MQPATKTRQNAVAAIRVSTSKQGNDSDSPEAQKELICRFAQQRGFNITKFFLLTESASGATQPMQQVVDYCKNPKNQIDMVIIKSIDRFTRGGTTPYDLLKVQLDELGIALVDSYGIISSQKINTLEHLNQEYSWSTFSPSRKAEVLEAERSKDEVRDILSRVIGAEIRYTQMGYWMRQAPYGYVGKKVDTAHGKRIILQPHPEEAKYIIKIFELRATGQFTDEEIAQKLNASGYTGRPRMKRDKYDKGRIIRRSSGTKLNGRNVWRMARNPIYAGVNTEKWTNGEPVKCMFDGLVSFDLFNRANTGRRTIIQLPDHKIAIEDRKKDAYKTPKGTRNAQFPYKKFVMCPQCSKPLLGSASKSKNGKHYSYYHCDKRGHKFRVSKEELETSVMSFVSTLQFSQEHIDTLFKGVQKAHDGYLATYDKQVALIDVQINQLSADARNKAKDFSSIAPSARQYINEDLEEIDLKIKELSMNKMKLETKKPVDIEPLLARVKHYVEHLGELTNLPLDPIKKAQFFGLIFDQLPTYADLKSRTQKKTRITGVISCLVL